MTLDAGALIAAERGDLRMIALVARALAGKTRIYIPAGALAQAWRDGRRQSRLAQLLSDPAVDVVALDEARARAAGALCGATGTADIVDASVVICAREHGNTAIITTDARDLRRLDPRARIVALL